MIYYYHCYRGAHLSIVAAALHLNMLGPSSRVTDILKLEYFDKLQTGDMGVPVLAGLDRDDNPVYFVGLGKGSKIFARFAESFCGELELGLEYKSVDCLQCLGLVTRIGGILSNYKLTRKLGRYLAARGVSKKLGHINTLVLQARNS